MSCSTDTVAIKKIHYVQEDSLMQSELVISVQSSSYNNTKLGDAMIKSAALTAQSSANGSNCHTVVHEVCGDRPPCSPEKMESCNAAGFAGVQYYDGQQVGAAMWLDALWEFDVNSDGTFACERFLEVLHALLITVAPEFGRGRHNDRRCTCSRMRGLEEPRQTWHRSPPRKLQGWLVLSSQAHRQQTGVVDFRGVGRAKDSFWQ